MPKHIEKKVLIWLDVTIEERTDKQTNKQGKMELLSQYGPWTAEMSNKAILQRKSVILQW